MKQTILIAGTYKANRAEGKRLALNFTYNIGIFATDTEGALQLIADREFTLNSYASLWQAVTELVAEYYSNPNYMDGAYTAFMERLTETN